MHGDFLNTNIHYFGLSPFLLNVYHASCEKNVTFCSLIRPEQNLMFRVCSLTFDVRDCLMKFWWLLQIFLNEIFARVSYIFHAHCDKPKSVWLRPQQHCFWKTEKHINSDANCHRRKSIHIVNNEVNMDIYMWCLETWSKNILVNSPLLCKWWRW